jgi:hypothetical protein
MTWQLPDTYHLAGNGRGTATLKFYEGRDILRLSSVLVMVDREGGGAMTYLPAKVRCEERSGYPCDKIVALDSPNCGNRVHFPGANGGVSISRRRPRMIPLTVPEDYEIVDDTPDLDLVSFDTRRIHVTLAALEAWGRHSRALQARIREALFRGGYWRTAARGHLLEAGRHQMLLSSDGYRCESYVHLPVPPAVPCGDALEALAEPTWDREAVALAPHAVRQFAGRHRVSEDESVEELFALLDDAAARGRQHRIDNGNHCLAVDGFTLVLTADGATVVSYRTFHVERTPAEVRGKVQSRFGGARHRRLSSEDFAAWVAERDRAVTAVPPERWIPTAEVAELFDPSRVRITAEVIDPSREDRRVAMAAVRKELRKAAAEGRWRAAGDGRHVLGHGLRDWLISADGRGLLGCDPPWPRASRDEAASPQRSPEQISTRDLDHATGMGGDGRVA